MIYRNSWKSYPTYVRTIETKKQIRINDRRYIVTSIAITEYGNKLIDIRIWDDHIPRSGILLKVENAEQLVNDVDDVLNMLADTQAVNTDRDGYGTFSALGYNPFRDNED